MSVTGEQWVQAEAERQKKADMVQTLTNEVRRLGTEQNNNLLEIQRLGEERVVSSPTAVRVEHKLLDNRHRHLRQDVESSTQ